MCANRTPYRSSSIDEGYETFYATVTVERGTECVRDIVIDIADDGPGEPDVYIDN
jgi:hypothetical protein